MKKYGTNEFQQTNQRIDVEAAVGSLETNTDNRGNVCYILNCVQSGHLIS